MAVATYGPAWAGDLPNDLGAGGGAVSGVYDLEPIRLSYHNKVLNVAPQDVVPWSPLHALPRQAPPMVLAVGAAEKQEFLRQHAEYAAGWQRSGLRLEESDMAGLHHISATGSAHGRENMCLSREQQV